MAGFVTVALPYDTMRNAMERGGKGEGREIEKKRSLSSLESEGGRDYSESNPEGARCTVAVAGGKWQEVDRW